MFSVPGILHTRGWFKIMQFRKRIKWGGWEKTSHLVGERYSQSINDTETGVKGHIILLILNDMHKQNTENVLPQKETTTEIMINQTELKKA